MNDELIMGLWELDLLDSSSRWVWSLAHTDKFLAFLDFDIMTFEEAFTNSDLNIVTHHMFLCSDWL